MGSIQTGSLVRVNDNGKFRLNQRVRRKSVEPILDFCGFKDIAWSSMHLKLFLGKFFKIDFVGFFNLLKVNNSQLST